MRDVVPDDGCVGAAMREMPLDAGAWGALMRDVVPDEAGARVAAGLGAGWADCAGLRVGEAALGRAAAGTGAGALVCSGSCDRRPRRPRGR